MAADCGEILISCPTITCQSDMQLAFTALCSETQTALDQLKACIEAYEVSEMDICTAKDDLKDAACHLEVDMIDFTGILYGPAAGVGILPYPSGGIEWKWGQGQTPDCVSGGYPAVQITVSFEEAFATACVFAAVVYESAEACCAGDPGGINVMHVYAPLVRDHTAAGFTFWPCGDSFAMDCKLTYRYMAAGY